MVSLIARSPCEGLLPLTVGGATLTELSPGSITSVSPLAGQDAAVHTALAAHGLGWPAPGGSASNGDAAILWTGRGQAFLFGREAAGLAGIAALADQSDAWAVIEIAGPGVTDILARLYAVDLRLSAFPTGLVVRSGLTHMMSILHRTGPDRFRVMVFRSMAQTAVHELHAAMNAVAARSAI